MAIAIAIALPVGLALGHTGRGAFLTISVSNVGRAVPSIALIAFFVAFFPATPEFWNVTLALALLAIPPILTNAFVGVRQVSRDAVDAARGMGMSGGQIVRSVELPLALPLIFGGIRTSTVNVIATATIAPLVGVLTLGDPIISGSVHGRAGQIGASIVVALLAVVAELGLSAVQRAVTPTGIKLERGAGAHGVSPRNPQEEDPDRPMKLSRLLLALLVLICSAGLVAACGEDEEEPASTPAQSDSGGGGKIQSDEANADIQLTIGSKNFTEQKVLGEIYAQGLEAAGFTVSKDLNLGDEKTALAALKSGEISAYPEYTGTALLSFFGKQADELPKDEMAAFEEARAGFEAEGLVALPPTPFTSSNEVAVRQETADELGLKTISDLDGKSQDLTLYGSPECRQRLDCLLGLQQVYGLKFKKFVPVDVAQRHEVLSSGRADVSIVFTTDPQIQREQEVLLEDDKGMFPPYNSTLVLRKEVADQAGESLTSTVEMIQEELTDENMQELNARVDLDKKDPATVAQEYLSETGLTGG